MNQGTFYSHDLMYDSLIKLAEKHLPNATINLNEEEDFRTIEIRQNGSFLAKSKKLKIAYRQRENPTFHLKEVRCPLEKNLYGMIEFVNQIKTGNTTIRDLLVEKIATINSEFTISCEQGYTPQAINLIRNICDVCSPFVFAQPSKFYNKSKVQHFLDEKLNLILDTRGESEVQDLEIKADAKYYDQEISVSDEAIKRKERSEMLLETHGVAINEHLPVIEEHVTLRSKEETIDRIYALVTVAARGEGVPAQQLQGVIDRLGINGFSENEKAWLASASLSPEDKANATWRYESLYALLWAIGRVEELPYPSVICPVEEIVKMIIQTSRKDFTSKATMRSTSEILDQLDLIYRMNWACVNARIKGEEVSGGLHPGIVYERHYALNWLVNYMEQDWDNISTDT